MSYSNTNYGLSFHAKTRNLRSVYGPRIYYIQRFSINLPYLKGYLMTKKRKGSKFHLPTVF